MTTKPRWLHYDNRMDRVELLELLSRLSPVRRLEWLQWCCDRAALPRSGVKPGISRAGRQLAQHARWEDGASERLNVELLMDLIHLASQYKFDVDVAIEHLVLMVRCRDNR